MSKYYKAEDVIKAFKEWLAVSEAAEDIIADLPTIDIMRCDDCEYFRDNITEDYMPLHTYCSLWERETE